MTFVYNDGGRNTAGYKGETGDCVTRAVAIATEKSYSEVYDILTKMTQEYSETHRDRFAKAIIRGRKTARTGIFKVVTTEYLKSLGWQWIPTMQIGSGCKVHLKAEELPAGRLIARVSKHMVAVVDGVIHDTYDCSREGTRCVYGYYRKE